jgi:hypothetical protein
MTGFTSTLNASLILVALSVGIGSPTAMQAGQAPASSAAVSEEQVQEAVAGISQAKGYNELVAALGQYKSVLGSQRARALVDERLREVAPDNPNGRKLLQILGQLFADTSNEGPETGAARYLTRLIAMSAMVTGDSDQLERLLKRYFEFSPKFTAELIKPSLATPKIDWPPAMPRLMAEFVEDWHRMGANEAARSFADALHASVDDPTGAFAKMRDLSLVGQWYSTQRGISGQPEDTNLILTQSGVARSYVSTGGPEDIEAITAGRWTTAAGVLMINWDDGQSTTARYELSNGQLQWVALGARTWLRR